MRDTSPRRHIPSAFNAPVMVALGCVIMGAAWLLPANLKSISPALLQAAGRGTPTLGAYGRDLVAVEKIGPAAMLLAAARATKDLQSPALAAELELFASRQPGLIAWGGWDPFLDPLFNLRSADGRRESTPVLTFFVPERARGALRAHLAKSGSDGVQSLLKLRELTDTGRFVPAARPGGQPLDALILLAGLLYEGGHLSAPLQRELRALVEEALRRRELGEQESFFMNLLSLGRRLDWTQLVELMRRTDSAKTLGEYAHLARVAPGDLPLVYAAALFSDSADRVAGYLIEHGKTGMEDLRTALGHGQGAVKQLLLRRVPINRTGGAGVAAGAELALMHPQLVLGLKYLGYFLGMFLALRGLDRWLGTPNGAGGMPASAGHMKAGLLSLVFGVLFVIGSEPFLLKALPPSEFQFRLPALIPLAATSTPTQPIKSMDSSTLISIGFFAALQIAMYFACLLKIREVARQPVSALVKLRLMENEENLFDGGLYVGIGGTATALVLQVLGVIEANLLAAYSSNLFGILCVAMVKIRHVRPYKRQLILEGQVGRDEAPVAGVRGSVAP